ncbi:MAG: alpha/beta fold hydrolase [Woeseiaceae bacterium]|nr:alpha/beta fold hydrolase [Woeseiaceae bacterium]
MRIVVTVVLLTVCVAACGSQDAPAVSEECSDSQLNPVLFVHGSGLSSDSWGDALHAFRRAGYASHDLYAIDLVPNDGDNVAAAERQIARAVDQLLQGRCDNSQARRVDIIAHSMGAFSSRWYAAQVAPEHVRTLITVAGANYGTDALCGIAGAGNRQMCPARSDRAGPQAILNGSAANPVDSTPFGAGTDSHAADSVPPDASRRIVYLTVRIEPDEWIVPAASAELDGAGGISLEQATNYRMTETSAGNYRFDKSVSHDELPYDPDLIRFLLLVVSRESF